MIESGVQPYPTYDQDLFAPDALRAPFDHYRAIRDLGPVVRLPDAGVLAMGRFADVQSALRSPDALISSKGVGFTDFMNDGPPSLITSDGEVHDRLRMNLIRPLMPGALKAHRPDFKRMIEERVRQHVGAGWIDGIDTLARFLPVTVISHLVGLPEEARGNMLRWATASFGLLQPYKPELDVLLEVMAEARAYLAKVDRADLRPGGWADLLFQQADAGKLPEAEARAGLSGYTLPSLDTTIHSKSAMLYFLANNLDQWRILKDDPSLAPSAVLETVRLGSVVRWFTRLAATDYERGEVFIPQGARVALLYGSANRDERRYPNPDQFDVRRNPTDQLGWGNGPHICGGMHLAKLEMEVMLEALIENVDRIEVRGVVPSANGGLFGYDALEVRLT